LLPVRIYRFLLVFFSSSNTAGYAESSGSEALGVNHFREIGHSLQDGTSGVPVQIAMHFN